MLTIKEFVNQNMTGADRYDMELVRARYAEYFRDNAKVGDGATVTYYMDVLLGLQRRSLWNILNYRC